PRRWPARLDLCAAAPAEAGSSPLVGNREISIVIVRGGGRRNCLVDDPSKRRQRAHRVGVGGVARERKRLAATPSKVHSLARTAPARLPPPPRPAEWRE